MSTTIAPDPPQTRPVQVEQLFDVSGYQVDHAGIKFTGMTAIDLSDERFVELFHSLTPGKDHKLVVEVRVGAYASKFGEDEGGYVNDVAGVKTVVVHTVYRPPAE